MKKASATQNTTLANRHGWSDLTVAGLGSPASCDDRIGLTLVGALSQRPLLRGISARLWENADALTLAHLLLETEQQVLIVDCADMGLPAGSWRLFSEAGARLNLQSRTLSTHGLGLAEGLAFARSLGFAQELHLFGIQPFDLAPKPDLSAGMQQRLPRLLRALEGAVVSLTSGVPVARAPSSELVPNVHCKAP